MPTTKDDAAFAEYMKDDIVQEPATIATSALDNAVDWIVNAFDPGDIYPDKQMQDWAEANGYVKE